MKKGIAKFNARGGRAPIGGVFPDGKIGGTGTGMKRKYNAELLLITAPALFKILLFSFVPLIWLVISFQFYIPSGGILGSEWVGWDNFRYLVTSNTFFSMVRNAIVMNLLDISVGTVVGVLLGLLMFEITVKIQVKVLQTIFFFPYFITWAIAGALMDAFIGDAGYITVLIKSITGKEIDFYARPDLWWGILCFMGVWKGAGVSGVVNYAVLLGADREMYEAADLDGATRWQKMIYLSLPYMKNMLVVNVIMSCSNILRYDFSKVYFCTGNYSTLYDTTEVIETYMYRALRTSGLYEPSTAAGLLQSCVGLVLCAVANFITRKISPESSLF
ncbi:MAG: ABC transporter permease subunit [Candidatus Borkfalkiaceae bacterium]|nr:ABC transporter permease subunit [Christensenellaceae bacterium]